VAKKLKTFKMEEVETLVNEEIDTVIQDVCVSCIKRVGNLQEKYYSKEIRRIKILGSIIINLQYSDTEHEGCSNNDDKKQQ
jgi:hypothetical protein